VITGDVGVAVEGSAETGGVALTGAETPPVGEAETLPPAVARGSWLGTTASLTILPIYPSYVNLTEDVKGRFLETSSIILEGSSVFQVFGSR